MLTEYNREELKHNVEMMGEARGHAMYAMQILSDAQEVLSTNPSPLARSQAYRWINDAKQVLGEFLKESR